MARVTEPAALKNEDAIIWLADPERYAYVREWHIPLPTRFGRPKMHYFGSGANVLGFAILKPDAKRIGNYFHRRVFWLASHDWPNDGPYKNGDGPSEAVDPRSIFPRRTSASPRHEPVPKATHRQANFELDPRHFRVDRHAVNLSPIVTPPRPTLQLYNTGGAEIHMGCGVLVPTWPGNSIGESTGDRLYVLRTKTVDEHFIFTRSASDSRRE